MVDDAPRRLGRGLAALIGDAVDDAEASGQAAQRSVPIEFLRPNPRNPRRTFGPEDLDGLAESIREKGIIQPILVRAMPGMADVFEIIAGERRWRAAQRVGLHEVPIISVEANDQQALELAIVENVQRADLNAIEEAAGYEQLIADFGYTQNDLARVIGKSRSHIANTMRLLRLPDSVRKHVVEGTISAGHARALLTVSDPEYVARQIMERGLNVRDVEKIAQREAQGETKSVSSPKADKDADTRALEQALEAVLGLKVEIDHRAKGGEVRIKYSTLEQLDGLCQRLKT